MPHRDDIQGLRAVAVLLVALAHAGVPFLQGGYVGVDVFFVLSGFLITGLLLSEAAERGRISLASFYARRARRILPAAALTLAATQVAAHQLLNVVRARQVASDSLWASAFGANIDFARQGGDYFAEAQPPSPILHFWSLSVEEQFYFVWPTVLAVGLASGLLMRRTRHVDRRLLLVVVSGAGLVSLGWSIAQTAAAPTQAYFSTFARGWELALGAALAVALPRLERLPSRVLVVGGWLGLGAIGAAAVSFSSGTAFPGYAALLPTTGAALAIVAGVRRPRAGGSPTGFLSTPPLRYVGDRSYAFYLWHWPVLVIAAEYWGDEVPLGARLTLLLGAFALSIASYRFVENPIRRIRFSPRVGPLLWPASAAVVLPVALVILHGAGATAARLEAAAATVRPAQLVDVAMAADLRLMTSRPLPAVVGAVRAAERGAPLPSPLTPAVTDLRGDFYYFPDGCTPGRYDTTSKVCRLGAADSPKTIVVFGDSHAQMWMPTILAMARRDRWTVIPLVKVRCVPRSWTGSDDCGAWFRWAKRRAQALRPDVTLIIGSRAGTSNPLGAVEPVAALTKAMRRSSASVIVLGDAPTQTRDPVDCLLAPGATMKTCTAKGTRIQARTEAAIASDARKNGAGFVDARPWLCAHPRGSATGYLCPMVVNRTITYVDRGHISRTYGLELVQPFRVAFRRELFR